MFERLTSSLAPVLTRATRLNSFGLFGLAAVVFAAGHADANALTPGNVVVVRIGDGAAALSGTSAAVFLDEYNTAGGLVQTLALPTAVSGANQPLTNSGSASSEGFLGLSANGAYLLQGGYAAAPGTSGIAATTATAVPRVIGRVDMNGNIDTTTVLNDTLSFSGSNIRSVASTNGTEFWAAGTASSGPNGGVRYVPNVGPNPVVLTQLSASPTNTRVVNIFAGQLYVTSASGAFQGLCTVGTGLPTTGSQTTTVLPGFPTAAGPSNYDFFFVDPNTVYVADDRTNGSGGIQKWTFNGTTWGLQYTMIPAPNIGCRAVTGTTAGTMNVLFATTTDGKLERVVDTTPPSAFSVIATQGTNMVFRGVRYLPTPCVAGADCNTDGIPDSCDIALGISGDLNANGIPDSCEQNGGTPYCFGDGSGAACPCGNNSAVGAQQGCASSPAGGASLTGSGTTSVSNDSLLLTVSNLQLPGGSSGTVLYFQGTTQLNAPFNDGLRCVGGSQVRLSPKPYMGTSSTYPQAGDQSVSVRGGIPAAGGAYNYQVWYRVFPSACGSHSNLSSGLSVVWMP